MKLHRLFTFSNGEYEIQTLGANDWTIAYQGRADDSSWDFWNENMKLLDGVTWVKKDIGRYNIRYFVLREETR
jgi:hypothetical protein